MNEIQLFCFQIQVFFIIHGYDYLLDIQYVHEPQISTKGNTTGSYVKVGPMKVALDHNLSGILRE